MQGNKQHCVSLTPSSKADKNITHPEIYVYNLLYNCLSIEFLPYSTVQFLFSCVKFLLSTVFNNQNNLLELFRYHIWTL